MSWIAVTDSPQYSALERQETLELCLRKSISRVSVEPFMGNKPRNCIVKGLLQSRNLHIAR